MTIYKIDNCPVFFQSTIPAKFGISGSLKKDSIISFGWNSPLWIYLNRTSKVPFFKALEISQPKFKDELIEDIELYGSLPLGWAFGEGDLISQTVITRSVEIYLTCKSLSIDVEPHPNEDGTITLIAYISDNFLEIEVTDGNYLSLRYAKGKGTAYTVLERNKVIHVNQIENELKEMALRCNKNSLSELSISNNTAFNSKGSDQTKPSLPEVEAFPFLMNNVQISSLQALAPI